MLAAMSTPSKDEPRPGPSEPCYDTERVMAASLFKRHKVNVHNALEKWMPKKVAFQMLSIALWNTGTS